VQIDVKEKLMQK